MQDNDIYNLNDAHRACWEQPENYALIKESHNGKDFFIVFTIKPVLLMMLADDIGYIDKLSKRMIENGVKIFDKVEDLWAIYSNQKNSSTDDTGESM